MMLLEETAWIPLPPLHCLPLRTRIAAKEKSMTSSSELETTLPPGFILLRKAVLIGWAVQWDNVTFGIERLERKSGRKLKSPADRFGRVRLLSGFDTLDKSPIKVSVGKKIFTIKALAKDYKEIWERPFWPNAFALELKTAFQSAKIEAFVLDKDLNTEPIKVDYWTGEQCLDALLRGAPMRVPGKDIEGPVVIRFSDLRAYLTPPGQLHPLARASLTLEAVQHVTKNWQMQTDEIYGDSPVLPPSTSDPQQYKSGKSRHKRQRVKAEGALSDLFPNGVPDRNTLSDTDLFELVNDHLKGPKDKRDTTVISSATVMRAAGRRKDGGSTKSN